MLSVFADLCGGFALPCFHANGAARLLRAWLLPPDTPVRALRARADARVSFAASERTCSHVGGEIEWLSVRDRFTRCGSRTAWRLPASMEAVFRCGITFDVPMSVDYPRWMA